MALADSKFHLKLAGDGLTLIEESYSKQSQNPFNPRFSTGDPSLTDLSFWQFLTQETWDGGSGQTDYSTTNKIRKSRGWSFLTGKPKLAGGNAAVSLDIAMTALTDTRSGSCNTPYPHQILLFGSTTRGRFNYLIIGPTSSSFTYDATAVTNKNDAASTLGIKQLAALGGCLWYRQTPASAESGFLVATIKSAGTNYVRVFDSGLAAAVSQDVTTTYAAEPTCHVPVSENAVLCAGTGTWQGAGGYSCLMLLRLDYTAQSFAAPTIRPGHISDFPDAVSPFWAKDSSANIYLVCNNTPVLYTSENFVSGVAILTSADALAASGPIVSETLLFPDFHLTGATSINGTVYYIGCKIIRDATVKFRTCVIKHPRTVIWESEYTSAVLDEVVPRTMFRASRAETYFFDRKLDGGEYQPLMRLGPNDVVEEVYALEDDATGDRNIAYAIGKAGQWVHVVTNGTTVKRLSVSASDARNDTTKNCDLFLSSFGANTPLINKTLYTVTIELSEAITSGQTMTIFANDTSIGTIVNADGTRKEITLTTEITASSFDIKIRMAGTATWPGEVEKVTLRYVPTQFKKYSWAFGIRVDRNLKLIDGSRETRTPAEILTDIEDAWESNVPITLTDLDGTAYTVLVTDLQIRRPLIHNDINKAEAYAFVECLQV